MSDATLGERLAVPGPGHGRPAGLPVRVRPSLDEPLSALDAIVRLHLRQEIRALQRRLGVTTIMVTHDQEEAMGVSDRIVVMSRGRVEQVGTPEEVYRRPASAFVAGFVGRSSMIEAKVGASLGTLDAAGHVIAAEACLLYTSPSPRDRQKSRMPSSA